MRSFIVLLSVVALATSASVDAKPKGSPVYVAPHVTKTGTYVKGSMRTSPNTTRVDNYSTKGNVNPYTGEAGTKSPYRPYKP